MARRRFIVEADDLAVQKPAGKVHYPPGTPVELDDQGVMFPFIADKLREPDPQRDQRGQAAVVLDAPPVFLSGHRKGTRN